MTMAIIIMLGKDVKRSVRTSPSEWIGKKLECRLLREPCQRAIDPARCDDCSHRLMDDPASPYVFAPGHDLLCTSVQYSATPLLWDDGHARRQSHASCLDDFPPGTGLAASASRPTRNCHSAIGHPSHSGKRSSVLQERQVLDGNLPFPAQLANVGFVPTPVMSGLTANKRTFFELETRKNRVISAWLDRRRGFGAHERHRSDRFPRCLALISPVWLACRQSQPLHSRRSWKIRRLKL